MRFDQLLSGGDIRSIGNSNIAVTKVHNQYDFNELFQYIFGENRLIITCAADTVVI